MSDPCDVCFPDCPGWLYYPARPRRYYSMPKIQACHGCNPSGEFYPRPFPPEEQQSPTGLRARVLELEGEVSRAQEHERFARTKRQEAERERDAAVRDPALAAALATKTDEGVPRWMLLALSHVQKCAEERNKQGLATIAEILQGPVDALVGWALQAEGERDEARRLLKVATERADRAEGVLDNIRHEAAHGLFAVDRDGVPTNEDMPAERAVFLLKLARFKDYERAEAAESALAQARDEGAVLLIHTPHADLCELNYEPGGACDCWRRELATAAAEHRARVRAQALNEAADKWGAGLAANRQWDGLCFGDSTVADWLRALANTPSDDPAQECPCTNVVPIPPGDWGRCEDCGAGGFPLTAEAAGQCPECGWCGECRVDCPTIQEERAAQSDERPTGSRGEQDEGAY